MIGTSERSAFRASNGFSLRYPQAYAESKPVAVSPQTPSWSSCSVVEEQISFSTKADRPGLNLLFEYPAMSASSIRNQFHDTGLRLNFTKASSSPSLPSSFALSVVVDGPQQSHLSAFRVICDVDELVICDVHELVICDVHELVSRHH